MINTEFQDKVIIITGASYGIGEELALQLAEQGACLALSARTADKLNDVSQHCQQRGAKAIVVPTDVSKLDECRNLINQTIREFGRIDMLINNAGIGVAGRFDEMPNLGLFEKVIQINFLGSVYCTYFALPYLKETRGRIVAISSLRGMFPSATADGYGASKHAMVGFYGSLRNELYDSGVSITMIYPGWVCSGITSRALKIDGHPTGQISPHEVGAMSVETCARRIIEASEKRKRQLIMTFQGHYGQWVKLIAPGFVDQVTRKET